MSTPHLLRKPAFRAAFCTVAFSLLPFFPAASQTTPQQAWQNLDTALNGKKDDQLKAVAALSLLNKDPQAIERLKKCLDDDNPEVRTSAAKILGTVHAPGIVELLAKKTDTEKDPTVLLAEANSLVELGDDRGYDLFYAVLTGTQKAGPGIKDQETKLLHDPKQMSELALNQGVAFIPFAGLGLQAVRMLRKDDVSPVRAAAARILSKDPDAKTRQALINATTDKNGIVRTAAVDALARRDDPTVLPVLEDRVQDTDETVRFFACAGIIRLSALGNPSGATEKKSAPRH